MQNLVFLVVTDFLLHFILGSYINRTLRRVSWVTSVVSTFKCTIVAFVSGNVTCSGVMGSCALGTDWSLSIALTMKVSKFLALVTAPCEESVPNFTALHADAQSVSVCFELIPHFVSYTNYSIADSRFAVYFFGEDDIEILWSDIDGWVLSFDRVV